MGKTKSMSPFILNLIKHVLSFCNEISRHGLCTSLFLFRSLLRLCELEPSTVNTFYSQYVKSIHATSQHVNFDKALEETVFPH